MTSECSAVSCVVIKCMHPAESWTRTRTARVCQHGHHHLRLHPLTRWSWRRALWLNPTYGDPPHEFMQSSHSCNRLMTWPQTQMAAHDFTHMQRLSTWTHSQGQATITHISSTRNKASSSAQVSTVVCVKSDCAQSNNNMTCMHAFLSLSVLHRKVLVDSNHKHDYLREVKNGKRGTMTRHHQNQ